MSADDTDAPGAQADRPDEGAGRGNRPQSDQPRGQDRRPRSDDDADASGGSAEDELFGDSESDPSAKEGRAAAGGAAARIARESRSFFLRDSSTYVGGTIGSVNFRFGDTARASLLAGPLPDDELQRLRRRFTRPPDYDDFKRRLRNDHLLVLCGQPGGGRTYTALSLLDDLTRGTVSRLDPGSDLTGLDSDDEGGPVAEGHGYTLEPADGRLPEELHLDRLRRLLADRNAYAVLLSVPDASATGAPQARYCRTHTPAAEDAVLDGHLAAELDRAPTGAREAARQLARRDDVRAALGLETLLPAEAARLAGLVARHVTGELSQDELLTQCRGFAAEQVREWFAGGAAAETLPALRDAAYRIALAVFGNSSFNVAAEAAELLAWELAVTAEPERVPGRPLLSDGLEARLTSTRATTRISLQPVVGGEDIPVRTVQFLGTALAPALLAHLWEHHHNMRGPVLRWLDSLCQDPREDVWTRAAVAAGELCRLDCAHTLRELLLPMAEADQARRGLCVATALQDVLNDPAVGGALRSLVKDWGSRDNGNLRWTAAAVLSRGTATRTTGEALSRLGRIGTWEDGRLRSVAADSVTHLAGSTSDREPLARIRAWLGDSRRQHQNLGLVSALFLARTLVEEVWSPAADLAGHEKWPLPLAISATRPDQAAEVAGLLWTALNTSRSYQASLDAVAAWLRTCPGKPWEADVLSFLPLLVLTEDDRQRMLSLIRRLAQDPDEPLAPEYVQRLLEAVQTVQTGRIR